MNRILSLLSGAHLALVAGVTMTAGAVVAAETAEDALWITVKAPRVVRQTIEAGASNAAIELVSLTHRVSYAGLDLAMYADVMELEKRINESAQTACAQLAVLNPLANLDTRTCVQQAVNGALAQAEEAIAAANGL